MLEPMGDAVAVVTAVLVGWLGFRFAIRQDERRWSREQRAQVYIELLAESSAELDDLQHRLAERELGEPLERPGEDDRMASRDRRLLAARVGAFGSREVVRRWNRFIGLGMKAGLALGWEAAYQPAADIAFDDLEKQIRHELETERLAWFAKLRRPRNAESSKFLEMFGRGPSGRPFPGSHSAPIMGAETSDG